MFKNKRQQLQFIKPFFLLKEDNRILILFMVIYYILFFSTIIFSLYKTPTFASLLFLIFMFFIMCLYIDILLDGNNFSFLGLNKHENNFIILKLEKDLNRVDSISQQEKEELINKFYNEYDLSYSQNGKVIIDRLPTYIKIQQILQDYKSQENEIIRIAQYKKEVQQHNEYIKNVFNDLPKPVQNLININDFLVENFKETNNFKLLKNKFHSNIDHIKQNLLFDKDLKMNKNKFNYPTSNDYQKLVNHLLEYPEERIICLVYEKHNNPVLSYASFKDNYFTLGTIGICWFDTDNKEEFVRLCIKYNVEYIMPYAN